MYVNNCGIRSNDDNWSYPGNGGKCSTIVGYGSLLWPSLRDYHICIQMVCLPIPFVSTLFLKIHK